MDYDKLLLMSNRFCKLAARKKGKSLAELGHPDIVIIFRAVPAHVKTFGSMDYVTLSRKFAKEHAEHGAVVDEEPHHVLMVAVSSSNVFEAYNPGEYFYDGPAVKGSIIYTANPQQY